MPLEDERIFDFVITQPNVIDKDNEKTPGGLEIEKSLDAWLINDSPISMNHTNNIVGKGLRWWKGIYKGNPETYFARGVINKNSKIADMVWRDIQTKKFKDVSLAGASFDPRDKADGVTELGDLDIVEVAVCEDGKHPNADIVYFNSVAKANGKEPYFVAKSNNPRLVFPSVTKQIDRETELEDEEGKPVKPVAKPFAGFNDFDDCVSQNQQARNPEALCATIMREVEGKGGGYNTEKQVKQENIQVCRTIWFRAPESEVIAFGGQENLQPRDDGPTAQWLDNCSDKVDADGEVTFSMMKLNKNIDKGGDTLVKKTRKAGHNPNNNGRMNGTKEEKREEEEMDETEKIDEPENYVSREEIGTMLEGMKNAILEEIRGNVGEEMAEEATKAEAQDGGEPDEVEDTDEDLPIGEPGDAETDTTPEEKEGEEEEFTPEPPGTATSKMITRVAKAAAKEAVRVYRIKKSGRSITTPRPVNKTNTRNKDFDAYRDILKADKAPTPIEIRKATATNERSEIARILGRNA